MRARFAVLTAEKNQIVEQARPHRQKYDAMRKQEQALQAEIAKVAADMKRIEAPLAAIEEERAMLTRALKGKTGTPEQFYETADG
jgi:septal ring factor EnvC (AmiA/AmiB activator)